MKAGALWLLALATIAPPVSAIVIDAAVLAYEPPPDQPSGPRVLPMGKANQHGGVLGVMGRF